MVDPNDFDQPSVLDRPACTGHQLVPLFTRFHGKIGWEYRPLGVPHYPVTCNNHGCDHVAWYPQEHLVELGLARATEIGEQAPVSREFADKLAQLEWAERVATMWRDSGQEIKTAITTRYPGLGWVLERLGNAFGHDGGFTT